MPEQLAARAKELRFTPDHLLAFKDDGLCQLLVYWNSRRQGQPMPARADLNPRDLKPVLSGVHLYDVLDDGSYRVRLQGTGLNYLLPADQTGQILREGDAGLMRQRVLAFLNFVRRSSQPLRATAFATAVDTDETVWLESQYAPLRTELGDGRMILAATAIVKAAQLRATPASKPHEMGADAEGGAVTPNGLCIF